MQFIFTTAAEMLCSCLVPVLCMWFYRIYMHPSVKNLDWRELNLLIVNCVVLIYLLIVWSGCTNLTVSAESGLDARRECWLWKAKRCQRHHNDTVRMTEALKMYVSRTCECAPALVTPRRVQSRRPDEMHHRPFNTKSIGRHAHHAKPQWRATAGTRQRISCECAEEHTGIRRGADWYPTGLVIFPNSKGKKLIWGAMRKSWQVHSAQKSASGRATRPPVKYSCLCHSQTAVDCRGIQAVYK